jgi:hypothetical protein
VYGALMWSLGKVRYRKVVYNIKFNCAVCNFSAEKKNCIKLKIPNQCSESVRFLYGSGSFYMTTDIVLQFSCIVEFSEPFARSRCCKFTCVL